MKKYSKLILTSLILTSVFAPINLFGSIQTKAITNASRDFSYLGTQNLAKPEDYPEVGFGTQTASDSKEYLNENNAHAFYLKGDSVENSSVIVFFKDGSSTNKLRVYQNDSQFGEEDNFKEDTKISSLFTFNNDISSVVVFSINNSITLVWNEQTSTTFETSSISVGFTYRKEFFTNLGLDVKLREEWGAPTTSAWGPGYPDKISKIVVHHTATAINTTNPSQAVLDIYNYHKNLCSNNQGSFDPNNPDCDEPSETWEDIGYNYLIDQNGTIYEGRAGGNMVIGAHSPPNFGTIGIALIGNYQSQLPTGAAQNSLIQLVGKLAKLNNIDLSWQSSVFGHRDRNVTLCPGDKFYAKISELVNYANQVKASPNAADVQITEANKLTLDRQDDFFVSPGGYSQILIDKDTISEGLKADMLANDSLVKDYYETDDYIVISTDIDFTEKIVKETLITEPEVVIQPSFRYEKASWDNTNEARSIPSDYNTTTHWNMDLIKLPEAWKDLGGCSSDDSCGGDSNVTVAVIDTGVAYEDFDYDAGSSFTTRNFPGAYNMEVPASATPNGVYNEGIDRRYAVSPELNGVTFVNPYDASQDFLCDLRAGTAYPCNSTEIVKVDHANDDDGHGTFVSTIIAGDTGDTAGNKIVGIAHNVKIMPIKVFFPNDTSLLWDKGATNTEILFNAINWATANNADAINMSISGGEYDPLLQSAITNAYNNGSIVVAASGNQGIDGQNIFPGAFNNLISVGATNSDGNRSSYSNYGATVDIYAPVGQSNTASQWFPCSETTYPEASSLSDCFRESKYTSSDQFLNFTSSTNPTTKAGTSFAAPQVAAAVALIRSRNSNIPASFIENILKNTATNSSSGNAILNVNAALRLTFSNWSQDSQNTGKNTQFIEFGGKLYQSNIINGLNAFRNSADGITWSSWTTSGGNDGQGVYSIVFGGKLYQSVISGRQNWHRVSSDGTTWSSWTMSGGNDGAGIFMYVFNGRLYQAVISGQQNWFRSTDGNTWSSWSMSGGNDGQGIYTQEFNGELYQTIISAQVNWHRKTSDGTTWSGWSKSGGNDGAGIFMYVFNNRLHQGIISGQQNWFRSTDGTTWTGWSMSGGNDGQGIYTQEFNSKLYQSIISANVNWHRVSSDGITWSGWSMSGGNDGQGIFMYKSSRALYQTVLSGGIMWTRLTDGSVDGSGNAIWTKAWNGNGGTKISPFNVVFNNRLLQFVIAENYNWSRNIAN